MSMIKLQSICGRKVVDADTQDIMMLDLWEGFCCNECHSIFESRQAWAKYW